MGLFSKREIVRLEVGGMHCGKCVARVKETLENVEGVTRASVDLDTGAVAIEGHLIDTASIVPAIEALGFTAAVVD